MDDFPGSPPAYARYLCEFLGTFVLVLTVGCTTLVDTDVWGPTAVGSALMVMVYAMGWVSGAHLNPAVTVAIALTRKMESMFEAFLYVMMQVVAGVCAGFLSHKLVASGSNLSIEPPAAHRWIAVGAVEALYTTMLCFVVLNVACARGTEGRQFYGIAIGYVMVAGGYAAASLSRGIFNPAVAIGLACMGEWAWGLAFVAYQLVGSAFAALLFRVLRPEEFLGAGQAPELLLALLSEFIGTFFLVLTVGLNVLGKSPAAAWSIGASYMCMIYSVGGISGGHFNPAVTLAVLLSGRGKTRVVRAIYYVLVQLVAGAIGAVAYTLLAGRTFKLGPGPGYGWLAVFVAEMMFTFLLCFAVLNIVTVRDVPHNMTGLGVASCVTVGGIAVGSISGAALNPAVAFGIDTASALEGFWFSNCLLYAACELAGAFLAVACFIGVRPSEYARGVDCERLAQAPGDPA